MNRKGVLSAGIFAFFSALIFLVSLVSLASFSSAQTSSARTEFTIIGCSEGVPVGTCTGTHYCDILGFSRDTRLDNFRCALYSGCCQDGYRCACPNGGSCSSESRRCILRDIDCSTLYTSSECINQNCVWMNGVCYDPSSMQSCSSYTTKSACESDSKNLGKIGIGSEICSGGVSVGLDKVVVPESCKCVWNSSSSKCEISWKIANSNPGDNSGSFECRKDISVSPCTNGVQDILWKAAVSSKSPSDYIPSDEELQDAECVDEEKSIPCGQEVSLLPGFDFINIILVAGLLFAFYFFTWKKKFFTLFLFFGILFFSGFALAGTCDNSQQIYRLYQENNSHVQLPIFGEDYEMHNCAQLIPDDAINCPELDESACSDSSNVDSNGEKICQWISSSSQIYNYSICYNSIFGENYTGSEPHQESCDFPLFWVSKMSNSHASLEETENFNIPVCYGNLECTNISWIKYSANNYKCSGSNEKPVALAYSTISNETNLHVSFPSSRSIYGEVICCRSASINKSYWGNFNGNLITTANNQQKVKMIVEGAGLQEQLIEYSVYKDIPFWWDSKVAQSDGYGVSILNLSGFSNGNYYFKAKIGNTDKIILSGNLQVRDCNSLNQICNTDPNISIVFPSCGSNFFNRDDVSVTIQLNDPDDLLEGTLDFSDGESIDVSNLYASPNGRISYTHSFSEPGITEIILDVFGSYRGVEREFRRSSNIIVIDNTTQADYVAACIKEPEDLSFISSSFVNFNAIDTRALSFNPTLQRDSQTQEISKDRIFFQWTLSDDSNYEDCGSNSLIYNFPHQFADSGLNSGDLDVSLSEGGC